MSKDFTQSILDMTGCKVAAKGQYFEFNRKPGPGQRRLYLYIEGASKQEVANAYREIKRFVEEASVSNGGSA
jgi:ATP-dependent RNA helicase DDX46/PRP5